MAKLRKGGTPAITRGELAGDTVEIDHVLPVAVVPELAARFYNLEAIPAKANREKSAKICRRELDLARRWGTPITITRQIAEGAKGNVRAALADLEMWVG